MCRVLWPLVGVTLATAPLIAQDNGGALTIKLTTPGSLPVEGSTGADRVVLGRVSAGQSLSVPASALNIGKGKQVNVTIDRTGPETKLVLVPDGTSDAACENATRQRDDACEVAGTIPWGETAAIAAASVAGAVTGGSVAEIVVTGAAFRPAASPGAAGRGNRLSLAVGGVRSNFTSLEDGVCGGTSDCDVGATAWGLSLSAEYAVWNRASIGARASWVDHWVERRASALLQRQETLVTQFELYGRLKPFGDGDIAPWLTARYGWWQNQADIFVDGDEVSTRSQGGFRTSFGLGVDLMPRNARFGLRLGIGMGGFRDGDLDRATTFSGELVVNL